MALIGGRVERLTVYGFRSLRKLSLPFDHLAVYLGANGTGKTNIYRALELCHHAAKGDLSRWLARQGGMHSAIWAGSRKTHDEYVIEIQLNLGCYQYDLRLGFKSLTMAAFDGEPLIKQERISFLSGQRKYTIMKRKGPAISVRGTDNKKHMLDLRLLPTETALSAVPANQITPEIAELRDTLLEWRFYHAFRVDAEAPVSQCAGTKCRTGSSDGTIQFLALCGALLSYHTPGLIVLNEPETSLHPDIMPALAQLISMASETAQIIVVTHSQKLTDELERISACPIRTVYKEDGETKIENLNTIGMYDGQE